jgi:DNA-binding SARP family transcriptional activator
MQTLDIRFRFFGSFAIRSNGEWQSGPAPKKGREFLQYLGSHPRRVATRDDLADAFWPGADLDSVTHRIHLAASGARRYLRELLGGFDAIECVPGGYAWNPTARVVSDVDELFALTRVGDCESLKAVGTLYQGEFLTGEVGDWLLPLRVRCASAFAIAVCQLAEDAMQRGEYGAALTYGLHLVEWEPGHESARRLVIRCFAALGQRARAWEQYEALCAYLHAYLGVAPTAETTALARSLRSEVGALASR